MIHNNVFADRAGNETLRRKAILIQSVIRKMLEQKGTLHWREELWIPALSTVYLKEGGQAHGILVGWWTSARTNGSPRHAANFAARLALTQCPAAGCLHA